MDLKMKIIAKVGMSRFAPRWLKVMCLQLTMNRIEKGFRQVILKLDLSKISDDQRAEINNLITKINAARGKS